MKFRFLLVCFLVISALKGSEMQHFDTKSIHDAIYNQNLAVNTIINGSPILHHAITYRENDLNSEAIELLILNGANINSLGPNGRTPLISAIMHNNLKTVELLIRNRANIDQIDNFGETALFHAVRHNKLEIAKCLLKYGANFKLLNHEGKDLLEYAKDQAIINLPHLQLYKKLKDSQRAYSDLHKEYSELFDKGEIDFLEFAQVFEPVQQKQSLLNSMFKEDCIIS